MHAPICMHMCTQYVDVWMAYSGARGAGAGRKPTVRMHARICRCIQVHRCVGRNLLWSTWRWEGALRVGVVVVCACGCLCVCVGVCVCVCVSGVRNPRVCMCGCVCVFLCLCVRIRTCVPLNMCAHILYMLIQSLDAHTHIYTHIQTHTDLYKHIHIYTHVHCTHIHT